MTEIFGLTLPFPAEGLFFITLTIGLAIGTAAGAYLLRRR